MSRHDPAAVSPTMAFLIEDRARRYLRLAILSWRLGDVCRAWHALGVAEGQVLALFDTPRPAAVLLGHLDRVRRVFLTHGRLDHLLAGADTLQIQRLHGGDPGRAWVAVLGGHVSWGPSPQDAILGAVRAKEEASCKRIG